MAVPLIRTEGKAFSNGNVALTPARFAAEPLLLRSSKEQSTYDAERALDLEDSLYFYAGHACPDFGSGVVLVFAEDCLDGSPGTATPFDTGGLHAGHVHANGVGDTDARKAYCGARKVSCGEWRRHFDRYVAEHFTSRAAYVSGERPTKDDPTGRLQHAENERRAWTWELQKHDDHHVFAGALCVYMSEDYHHAVRSAAHDLLEPQRTKCLKRMSSPFVVRSSIEDDGALHARVEREIARMV